MGSFYTNYTLRGPSQQAVAKALEGRSAIVTPQRDGCVVVCDKQSDCQDTKEISNLADELSRKLECSVLAILHHDDDILWYELHQRGKLLDDYNSCPDYFDDTKPSGRAGGEAKVLCEAFRSGEVARVKRILREEDKYVFEIERHTDLAAALGLPSFRGRGRLRDERRDSRRIDRKHLLKVS